MNVVLAGVAASGCGGFSANGSHAAIRDSTGVSARSDIAVVLAAGDIAACTWGAWATAQLLDSLPGEIIVAGDAAYLSTRDRNPYRTCYDTTWGRHKRRTHPVPGNHDWEGPMRRLYFEYFGASANAPGGYHSFDVGRWHVLALNSNLVMSRGSAQWRWAAADLAAHPARCTLAFMHHPRFSSGPHTKARSALAIFPLLDSAGVDVLIGAHDHIYERFAPMNKGSVRDDDRGVRQFVVGTGGNSLYPLERVDPNSEAQNNQDIGVLKLTLSPTGYAWEFVSATLTDFRDSGSAACH